MLLRESHHFIWSASWQQPTQFSYIQHALVVESIHHSPHPRRRNLQNDLVELRNWGFLKILGRLCCGCLLQIA
jgi:hypothetical protein